MLLRSHTNDGKTLTPAKMTPKLHPSGPSPDVGCAFTSYTCFSTEEETGHTHPWTFRCLAVIVNNRLTKQTAVQIYEDAP